MKRILPIVAMVAVSCEPPPPPQASTATVLPVPEWRQSPSALRLGVLQGSYWLGGFDRPVFLAYSDGRLLVPTGADEGIPTSYGSVTLDPGGIDSLLIALGLEAALSYPDSLIDLAPNVSDQHSFFLVLPNQEGHRVVQLRAGLEESDRLDARVPPQIGRLLSNAIGLRFPDAEPWLPDSIEAYLWSYEHAPNDPPLSLAGVLPVLEDSAWTRLDDPEHPNPDEEWSIRLHFSEAAVLDSVIALVGDRQAFGLGGRKWALTYRWAFHRKRRGDGCSRACTRRGAGVLTKNCCCTGCRSALSHHDLGDVSSARLRSLRCR